MHCKTLVTTASVWYFGSGTRSATRSISSVLVIHARSFRQGEHSGAERPFLPHKKRSQTLPQHGRWSSCAVTMPCASAASQAGPVSYVHLGHASEGQSCNGRMLAKRQRSVKSFRGLQNG